MPAIDALQNIQRDLIRKALTGSVFIAAKSAATIAETSLFDGATGDLVALPTGYSDLGMLTNAGAQFTRAINTSDVESWQSKTASRSDVTSDSTTLQLAAQETKLATIGMYLGVDTATVSAGSNGVVRVNMPETAADRYYRVLSLAVDESDLGEIVVGRYMPNAKVTNFDSQSFAKGDDPILYPVTLTGYKDDTLGFSHSWFFGGAGWKARLVAMGLTAAAPAIPVITSASPLALPVAGGTMVRILGRGFTGTLATTGVKFAGTNATSWTVWSDGEIVAIAPAHAAGTGPIVVTNAVGASTTGPTVTYA